MKLKKRIKAAVVAAGVSLIGMGLSTTPASASVEASWVCDPRCFIVEDAPWAGWYEAEVNNVWSPSGSWIWVYGESNAAHTDYYLEGNSSMHTLWSPKDGSNSTIHHATKVTAFRVCGPNGVGGDDCSPWAHPRASY